MFGSSSNALIYLVLNATAGYWVRSSVTLGNRFEFIYSILSPWSASYLFYTANNYLTIGQLYTVRIVRTLGNVFWFYILGGVYGTWTLMSAAGGFGTNPVTHASVTTSDKVLLGGDSSYFIFTDPQNVYAFKKLLTFDHPIPYAPVVAAGGVVDTYLSGSPWQFYDATGRWTLADEVIDGQTCRTLVDTIAGFHFVYLTSANEGITDAENAYGTWEWSFYLATNSSYFSVIINKIIAPSSSYAFRANDSLGSRELRFDCFIAGVNTIKWQTANAYVAAATYYRIKIVRTALGVWTTYIKGGAYAVWTLIAVTSGTNPVTENTHTTITKTYIYVRGGADYGKTVMWDPTGAHSFLHSLNENYP